VQQTQAMFCSIHINSSEEVMFQIEEYFLRSERTISKIIKLDLAGQSIHRF
jgi:hypothetical protein